MANGVQYIKDKKGKTKAVQIPADTWEKILSELKKYDQEKRMRASLTKALKEVKLMQEGKLRKKSAQEFLNEL